MSDSTPPEIDLSAQSPTTIDTTPSKSAGSPDGPTENTCSICLGKLQNKSFTDGCFHQFCFVCLREWSKVRAVCPLCKQTFKSIIHNVRSVDDYDQHFLTPEENGSWGSPDGQRFRYRSTLTNDRLRERVERLDQRHREEIQATNSLASRRACRNPVERARVRRERQLAATSDFRRSIYIRGMRVVNVHVPGSRRTRDISAAFFRSNPACMHRLVPWLNRELNVLLTNSETQVTLILELILDLIKRYEIQSEPFHQHLLTFIGARTSHFIHEFFQFAKSPYDMSGFDRHAVYNENDEIEILSDSSSDDSIIVVSHGEASQESSNRSPEPPAERRRRSSEEATPLLDRVRDFLSSVDTSTPAQSGWESPTMEPTSASPLEPSAEPPIEIPDTPVAGPSAMSRPLSPIPVKNPYPPIEFDPIYVKVEEGTRSKPFDVESDSDNSDVVFVSELKPFDERPPVVLSSAGEEEIVVTKDLSKKSKRKKRKKSRSSSICSVRSRRRRSRTRDKERNGNRRSRERSDRSRQSSSRSHVSRSDRHRHVSRSPSHSNDTRSRTNRSISRSRTRYNSRDNSRHVRSSRSRQRSPQQAYSRHNERYRSSLRERHDRDRRVRSPSARSRNDRQRYEDDWSSWQRDRYRHDHRNEHLTYRRSRSPTSSKSRSVRGGSRDGNRSSRVLEREDNHDRHVKKKSRSTRERSIETKRSDPDEKHKKSKKKKKHKDSEDKLSSKSRHKHKGKNSSESSESEDETGRAYKKHHSGPKKSSSGRDSRLISDNAVSTTVIDVSDDDDLFR